VYGETHIFLHRIPIAEALKGTHIDNCSDYEPNTVWGLLNSELYKDWFNGTAIDSKPSLQEIATYGPSGRAGVGSASRCGFGFGGGSKFVQENDKKELEQ
jgi:hypothetical protein